MEVEAFPLFINKSSFRFKPQYELHFLLLGWVHWNGKGCVIPWSAFHFGVPWRVWVWTRGLRDHDQLSQNVSHLLPPSALSQSRFSVGADRDCSVFFLPLTTCWQWRDRSFHWLDVLCSTVTNFPELAVLLRSSYDSFSQKDTHLQPGWFIPSKGMESTLTQYDTLSYTAARFGKQNYMTTR